MKIPEFAPQLKGTSDSDLKTIVEFSEKNEVQHLFKKANDEYVYWDTFKHFDFPDTIQKDLAWMYLRFMRDSQLTKIPLKDKEGANFGYWQPDCILKILHYVDQNAAGQMIVDDPQVHAAEKDRYLISSLMEEAIASSQLEGAATTRKKAKEMLRSGRKPRNKAEQMILNNYITMKDIKKDINKSLSKELIKHIQASVTNNILDTKDAVGRFRKDDEQVYVVDPRDGQVLFEPPPANEIDNRISLLCDFANKTDAEEFLHPVIKAIILHFWLAYIHPFVDGNGRTARAIFYWYMLRNKYWLFEYLSISRILLRAPGQYARSYLYSEIDNQDLTYFLIFNLEAINLAIKGLQSYLIKKQKELKETVRFIKKHPDLNHRQYDILHHAVSHPESMYTIKYHKNIHNIVYQTARADLITLVKKGFLEKKKRGKEFFFIPAKNIHNKLREFQK